MENFDLVLTVMIYCLMISSGESAGKVFVTELPSGRRNCRRAEVLETEQKIHVLTTFSAMLTGLINSSFPSRSYSVAFPPGKGRSTPIN